MSLQEALSRSRGETGKIFKGGPAVAISFPEGRYIAFQASPGKEIPIRDTPRMQASGNLIGGRWLSGEDYHKAVNSEWRPG